MEEHNALFLSLLFSFFCLVEISGILESSELKISSLFLGQISEF